MHFRTNIGKAARTYCEPKRDRGESKKSERNQRNASAKERKRGLEFHWMTAVHQNVHSQVDYHLRTNFQTSEKESTSHLG